mgnify:CR=1 FL=1
MCGFLAYIGNCVDKDRLKSGLSSLDHRVPYLINPIVKLAINTPFNKKVAFNLNFNSKSFFSKFVLTDNPSSFVAENMHIKRKKVFQILSSLDYSLLKKR